MAESKRYCKDCKHCKGIGYDFWCGEGHTEYEVFFNETNCPYYEFHDWSKGTPNRTENKRFKNVGINHMENLIEMWDNDAWHTFTEKGLESFMNELNKENVELHQFKEKAFEIIDKTIERETIIAESIEKITHSPNGSAIN